MSISSRFDQFVASLRPTQKQIANANRQIAFLKEKLQERVIIDQRFILEKILLAGSNAKGTALRPTEKHPFDMDLAVYFHEREASKEQLETLLDFTLDQLCRIYRGKPREDFKKSGSAVKVFFRTSKLFVDVVPIIRAPSSQKNTSSLPNSGWIPRYDGKRFTSITCHIDFIHKRTQRCHEVPSPVKFNKLVRLVKYWNAQQGEIKQSSYFCELITAAAFEQKGVTSAWQDSLLQVFSFLSKNQFLEPIVFNDYYDLHCIQLPDDPVVILDTVNPTNNVTYKWDEGTRRGYMKRVQRAYEHILQAIQCEKRGDEEAALDAWCQVFGERFRGAQKQQQVLT